MHGKDILILGKVNSNGYDVCDFPSQYKVRPSA